MDHLKRVTEEFRRQADTFDTWAQKTDENVAARFAAALGEAGEGNPIDVACGPGGGTAAFAPQAKSLVGFDPPPEELQKAKGRCAQTGPVDGAFPAGGAP